VLVVAAQTGSFSGKAMTAGDIHTIVGNGTAGFSGDGGPAVIVAEGELDPSWLAIGHRAGANATATRRPTAAVAGAPAMVGRSVSKEGATRKGTTCPC